MSSSPASPHERQTTTPILEECKRLREVQSFLSELWQDEVNLYEHSFIGHDHHETRNRPNRLGTVENETLFPYHTALYPLLDCYDSIRDDKSSQESALVVRPSPAPMPFDFNGHRRSKFSPRLDRHGIQIEELATLEGHLPNSAWAIQQLMPRDRKAQFMEYESSLQRSANNGSQNNDNQDVQLQPQEGDNGNNIHDEASRHNNNRFWNILMNPFLEATPPVVGSDMSVPPDADDDLWEEDAVEAEGDDDGEWEDVDVDEDDEGNIELDTVLSSRAKDSKNARDFTFLSWWQHSIVKETRGVINIDTQAAKMPSRDVSTKMSSLKGSMRGYSPESLYESSPSSATLVLLKVLKHSLSDLQREFRLARAVLLLITDLRLCDGEGEEYDEGRVSLSNNSSEGGGIECLRRLLSIVSSEYITSCGGYCHEWYIQNGGISDNDDEFEDVDESAMLSRPNHYCSDWWEFLGSLSTLLSSGITYMTQEHANVICSFVIQQINRASSTGNEDSGDVQSSKTYLKQNIYFLNNAEQSEVGLNQDGAGCQKISTNLILTILSGLRQHAVSDRMRIVKLLNVLNNPDATGEKNDISLQISKTLKSYQACIDIMVDIGERCLLRLPTNVPSRSLGGMIVRGLVESYVGSDMFSVSADKPLSYLVPETDSNLRNVIDPLRYADAVTNASSNPLLDPSRSRGRNDITGSHSIEQLIGFQPPNDVQDIVKALFMRDLVDLQISGCGYGDFLSWCHLPISPEPLLVDYISNFPNNLGSADANAQQHNHWLVDEDGTELDHAHISARYDFSLLVFFRQWHSPWTPASHLSFSIPHRRAISTLALCAHRYHMPADVAILVNSFLPRSWWPDDRRCCWCRDCQLRQLKQDFDSKISSRQSNWDSQEGRAPSSNPDSKKGKKSRTLITCPGCEVAMACSNDHMKYLHQDGHKRYCGLPPFRAPFSAEDNGLCRQIFGETEEICPLADEVEEDGGEEVEIDDEGSWESVDSDDEAEETVRCRSDIIFSFFNDKSYKLQRREALPFANFF